MAYTLLLLLSLFAAVNAGAVAPGGCTVKTCNALKKFSVAKSLNPLFGYKYGVWNKNVSRSLENQRGGPVVNLEYFKEIGKNGSFLMTTRAKKLGDCCANCAKTKGCTMYQFFDSPTVGKKKRALNGFKAGTQCYLLAGGSDYSKVKMGGTPFAGTHKQQVATLKKFDPSWYVFLHMRSLRQADSKAAIPYDFISLQMQSPSSDVGSLCSSSLCLLPCLNLRLGGRCNLCY